MPGAKKCASCVEKKDTSKRGNVCRRNHQVLEESGFQDFWEDCFFKELKKFRMHLFQVRSNCKKSVTGEKTVCEGREHCHPA